MTAERSGRFLLGVNIDHVATIRQARRATYPDIVAAALAAESGGADYITVHLREDRRHITDSDLPRLTAAIRTHLNLEIAATDEMQAITLRVRPRSVCLVPEKRQELTTEGGLDAAGQAARLRDFCAPLSAAGIEVSLFIDPARAQIDAAADIGAPTVELHTGAYAHSGSARALQDAAHYADGRGFKVNAGHGLHLDNIGALLDLPIREFNIGHSIVARALFCGLAQAVREMRQALQAGG